ncbi:MAG: nucleoside monophosphate kinase [Patescibacteria group bacterium]|nr:nucleoside monophosphate kinase [Patescibacteria group bacterium]
MDLILFGIQGSGKGTQGIFIAEKYGFEVFETGAELRKLSREDSELGRKVKEIIEAGNLVPNDVVMEIVENFTNKIEPGKNVLFDGIPRKIEQKESLDALLNRLERPFAGILIQISEEEALRRLTTRRLCKTCKTVYPASYGSDTCECGGKLITRTDDNPESIKTRLRAYASETVPVIEKYKEEGKMIEVNGEQPIEKVTEEVFTFLDERL